MDRIYQFKLTLLPFNTTTKMEDFAITDFLLLRNLYARHKFPKFVITGFKIEFEKIRSPSKERIVNSDSLILLIIQNYMNINKISV